MAFLKLRVIYAVDGAQHRLSCLGNGVRCHCGINNVVCCCRIHFLIPFLLLVRVNVGYK